MPFLSKRNPYNAGYSIPKSVLDEPWWRGVHVSRGLPRRSVSPTSPVAAPWNAEYAVPSSVERTGVMPHVTKYRKRGTISDTLPVEGGLQGVDDMDNGSLGDSMTPHGTLSSREGRGVLGSTNGNFGRAGTPRSVVGKGDPVATFGREGALLVLRQVQTLPDRAHRKLALKAILEGIDSGLWSAVDARAAKLKLDKKYTAQTALEKAISIEFANRYLGQVVKLGKTGTVPTRGPLSLAYADGLGACACATQESLDGFFGSLGALSADQAKLVASGKAKPCTCSNGKESVKLTIGPINSCMCGSGGIMGSISSGISSIVSAPASVVKAASSVASSALTGLNKLACAVSSSSTLKGAVTTAAAIKGGPAGAKAASKGAEIASSLCGKGSSPTETYAAPPPDAPSGGKFPMMPVLIGGGILAAVLLLKKKG